MKLEAFSDGCRIWIESADVDRDHPDHVMVRFRVPHGSGQLIPKRAERRLLAIARTMAEAANAAHGDPPTTPRSAGPARPGAAADPPGPPHRSSREAPRSAP